MVNDIWGDIDKKLTSDSLMKNLSKAVRRFGSCSLSMLSATQPVMRLDSVLIALREATFLFPDSSKSSGVIAQYSDDSIRVSCLANSNA
jgi:hypothetical protein